MKAISISLITLLFCSCNLFEEFQDYQQATIIDPNLKPYLDNFVKEAEVRGIHINTNGLKLLYKDLEGTVNGRAIPPIKTIFIDPKPCPCNCPVEEVVLHELGHLYLKREHDDGTIGDIGYNKSIMAGPGNVCLAHWNREYYINELFDPNTPAPKWSFR